MFCAQCGKELPGAGTYYLVFDNGFSLLTPKAVQADGTLRYMN
ncbi:MAG TPA: hypothetical protein VEG64_16930 [Candidatus Sulfotelmatobacter sp.]|nr:hypothetical protein [Candidatus Sulfotelmatobacter sp.]